MGQCTHTEVTELILKMWLLGYCWSMPGKGIPNTYVKLSTPPYNSVTHNVICGPLVVHKAVLYTSSDTE